MIYDIYIQHSTHTVCDPYIKIMLVNAVKNPYTDVGAVYSTFSMGPREAEAATI